MKTISTTLSALLMTSILATVALANETTTTEGAQAADPSGATQTEEGAPAPVELASGFSLITDGILPDQLLGDPAAPLTIVEYANFTCSHCGDFYTEVMPKLKETYVDTGKVNVVHREVITDIFGLYAVTAARCVAPEKYFGMAELLYTNQKTWAFEVESIEKSKEVIAGYTKLAGLSQEALDQCWADLDNSEDEEARARLDAMFAVTVERAQADFVQGTPTFLINGEKVDSWEWKRFEKDIEDALK